MLFTGCATKDFTGNLPREQIAILKVPGWILADNNFYADGVDGKPSKFPMHLMKLLPGRHTISFGLQLCGSPNYISESPLVVEINVEAGKTYRANYNTQYRAEYNTQVGPSLTWSVVITEEK
jgi:hypothetical protein